MTGEAASRAHLGLPGRQQELLEKIVATGKPVVLVLFSGRPLTLPWAFEHVPAVLAAWLPGIQAGPALARTLFGESIPPASWWSAGRAASGSCRSTTTRSIRAARPTRTT